MDNNNDPYPGVVYGLVESHGTSCSGAVALVKSNDVCGVGVAYNAGIAGNVRQGLCNSVHPLLA